MKTLSVAMIVKNESEMIRACLETIKEAEEIVIVDTGSSDNTVDICKEYTDKVFTYTGCNAEDGTLMDFSDARNHSLEKCTKDYILIIDADEELKDSIKGIKAVLNSGTMHKYVGMSFVVSTGAEELDSCRVIRRDPDIRYIYPFHNQLAFKGSTDAIRHHTYKSRFKIQSGFSPNHLKDPDRTVRIINNYLKRNPEDSRSLYYLGREYLTKMLRTEGEESDRWLNESINALESMDKTAFFKPWTNEYADGLYCLGNCYLEKLVRTQDIMGWYAAAAVLAKCVLILPTAKAPMKMLSEMMKKTPHGVPHLHAVKFWEECAKNASNADVAFKR